jgi:hypothetical protein
MTTAAKKTTAKKPTAKSRTTRRRRTPAKAIPLKGVYRDLAAAVLGYANERALQQDRLGVLATRNRELTGRRSGTQTTIRFDDGSSMSVTVAVRGK